MAKHRVSGTATEALTILGNAVRAGRLRRAWTVAELARRVGVSSPTITKVERGDPGVAVGTVLEAATLVGVPLFDPDPADRVRFGAQLRAQLALLPATARPRRQVDDDF